MGIYQVVLVERACVQKDLGLALSKEPNQPFGVVLRSCLGEDSVYESWLAELCEEGAIARPQLIRILRAERAKDPRLCQEVRLRANKASTLHHPSILRIMELAPESDSCGYVSELFDGKSLQQLLELTSKAGHALPIWFGLEVARQLARALEYAHGRLDEQGRPLGTCHGDVAPENIIITIQGLVKLIDFGLSPGALGLVEGPGTTQSAASIELAEVSPNLDWEGGRARDLRQIGSTLYRLLTGRSPELSFVPPSVHAPWISAELDAVIERLLLSDHPARVTSAGELACELDVLLMATRDQVSPSHVASLVSLLFVVEGCEAPPPTVRSEPQLRAACPPGAAASARRISGPSIKAVLPRSSSPEHEVDRSPTGLGSRCLPSSCATEESLSARSRAMVGMSSAPGAGPSRHDWDAALERVRREQASVQPHGEPSASDSRLRIVGLPEDPKRAAALLFERGFEAMQSGQLAEARDHWQRALELDPEHRACRANLKMLQKKCEQ